MSWFQEILTAGYDILIGYVLAICIIAIAWFSGLIR